MARILVVDDEKIPRVTVAATLQEAGHEVSTAQSGAECLERAREWRPDVIILDVHMPGMDGFETVAELKRDPTTAPIPVIFLTGTAPRDELVVRGLELGADDFLSKGCGRGELLARVGVMVRIKRGHDELAALASISDMLIRTPDPATMTQSLMDRTREVFRAHAALLFMRPDGGDEQELRAAVGVDPDDRDADALVRAVDAWLDETGARAAVVPVEQLERPARAILEERRLRSVIAAAVRRADVRPMTIAVLSELEHGFRRESDPELLHALARQASIAIENALLHARTREQTIQLERAMSERSRFFASMSHELRTPVNALLGYNQLLREGFFGELTEKQQTAIEKLERSAQHLLDLINDVLDISKIEARKIRIVRERTDLAQLARDTLTSLELQAREKGLTLEVDAPERIEALTDPARVRQILLNLLSNAVKFTEAGGVTVEARRVPAPETGESEPGGAWARIAVRDTGPGIAPEDRTRIFQEFEQVAGAAARGGTGLGLAISSRLAQLLGGRLTLESEVGVGSTFTIEIPLTAPSSAAGESELISAEGGGA